jgi:hypothetical protein
MCPLDGLRRNLDRVRLDGEVLLRVYLQVIDREELGVLSMRLKAFEGLCAYFQTAPTEKPRTGSGRTRGGREG